MANQLTPIASTVLTSTAASVTFSSISGAYTDLVLKISSRSVAAGSLAGTIRIVFNSDTSGNYSFTQLYDNSGSAGSNRSTAQGNINISVGSADLAGNTANTFSVSEIYIPNYAGSANKPISSIHSAEDNSVSNYLNANASLYVGAGAITSITISDPSNFAIASRFDLYQITHF
jgi:hypothetical protein